MRKFRVIVLALAALSLTSACAAGQIAATAEQQATLDGVNRTIGPIGLHGLSLGAPTEGPSYPAGSNIPINMVLVNSGSKPDKLVGITSGLAKNWSSYSQADANLVLNAPGARHAPGSQSLTIPPGSHISSGAVYGKQLVLLGTTRRIWPGNTVMVVFQFQNAGTIRVPVPIHLTEGERTGLTVPSETSPSPVGN